MKPHPLTQQNIKTIVIKRASGAKQIDLAKEFNSSTDRMLDVQKRNKHLIDIFDIDGNDFKISDSECKQNSHAPMLIVANDFICKSLEVTGNIEDGVLYTQNLYVAESEFNIDEFDLNDFHINVTDVGILKNFKVGKIFAVESIDNDLNFTEIGQDEFDTIATTVEENSKLSYIAKKLLPDNIPKNEMKVKGKNDPDRFIEKTSDEHENEDYTWSASNSFISISLGRDVWNADASHPNFAEALVCLAKGEIKKALNLINVKKAVERYVNGNIVIENGNLFYKGYNLKNGIAKRIIQAMKEGKDFEFFLPFLENLMLNPSNKAVTRLFDFLEANDIEITDDGHFIAWKKVSANYMDIFTNTMDNSPGKTVEIPRNQVDENDEQTCSHGLHVCSKSYLKEYAQNQDSKIVSVKVHPKDVVSIPVDYNNAKMRTCGYVVLEDKSDLFI